MPEIIQMPVMPGDSINKVASACLAKLADYADKSKLISFTFNGIPLFVTTWDTQSNIVNRYTRLSKAWSSIYRESTEFRDTERRNALEHANTQAKLNVLLTKLPSINTADALVAWLGDFASIADNTYLIWDKQSVIATIKRLGYFANDSVGLEKAAYSNKAVLARYIAGQALAALQHNMPPHPITTDFAKQYAELA